MKRRLKIILAFFLVAIATVLVLGACSGSTAYGQQPTLPGVEKYDMPYGFPAVITGCIHGTRFFESYTTKGVYGGESPALTLAITNSDASCSR